MESLMTEGLDIDDLSFCDGRPLIRRTTGQPGRAVDASPDRGTLHRLRWDIAVRHESPAEPRDEVQTFSPGPTPDTVRTSDGNVLGLPQGWVLLPPGDPALIRRVKAAGDHWLIWEKKGRKVTSRGVCAAAAAIDRIRAELEAARAGGTQAKRKTAKVMASLVA